MSCKHKFQSYLDLSRIEFEPTTLIVGTFNPAWPASNRAHWFYDRPGNNCFWEVLPRLYGEGWLSGAGQSEWKQFCLRQQIALTDLISSIDDAEPANPEHNRILAGYADKAIAHHFDDFEFVDIVQILRDRPSIKNVYLTRGVTESFWRHVWNPVMQYCDRNGLHERRLLTPSIDAAYQHEAYNLEHPDDQLPTLEDYILMKWREEWHF